MKNKNFKKILNYIKVLLFVSVIIATYFISTKTVDYLLTLDVELLKRSLNIILVVLVVGIYAKK